MSETKAKRIILEDEQQALLIEWADGHTTNFPLDGLRRACPCATCQGHENMHELPDPEIFLLPSLMEWHNVRLEPVGTYALRVRWDDGHATGIYTWDRLRRMCPCAICRGMVDV
jgi:DUF971 family protein